MSSRVAPGDRGAVLRASRDLKMARSVHAFVRGSTAKFYEWLAASPAAAVVPDGPPIWICGDCHVGNLGPIADADHHIAFQIRDLDQSVIGNPALDLVRLGLSLETAARSSDLPGIVTARMIEAMADGYARALTLTTADNPPEPDAVRLVRKAASGRRWRHLAEQRIGGEAPNIPLGKRFWPLDAAERDAIAALFTDEAVRARAIEIAGVGRKARLRVIDAAYWKKGCSSLGSLRYAVLLGITPKDGGEVFGLIDIKQAVRPVAPASAAATMPGDPAERVVAGACALAPNLGRRMIAARLLGKPVVLRELKPQDLKLELEQFSRREAERAAGYLAFTVGEAHARQLDADQREAWRTRFLSRPDARIDAPSWLWRTVVDLAGVHETGYLEHCRRYAAGE